MPTDENGAPYTRVYHSALLQARRLVQMNELPVYKYPAVSRLLKHLQGMFGPPELMYNLAETVLQTARTQQILLS